MWRRRLHSHDGVARDCWPLLRDEELTELENTELYSLLQRIESLKLSAAVQSEVDDSMALVQLCDSFWRLVTNQELLYCRLRLARDSLQQVYGDVDRLQKEVAEVWIVHFILFV